MLRALALSLAVIGLGCTAATAGSPAAAPTASPAALASLQWLVGTWTATTPEGDVVERWEVGDDGALVGHSETRDGDTVVFFEELRIEFDAAGRATYLARPMGREPATAFRESMPRAEHRLVVENPEHDYPKRITYARDGDALRATIAGDGREGSWAYRLAP